MAGHAACMRRITNAYKFVRKPLGRPKRILADNTV